MINIAGLEKEIYNYCIENKVLGVLRITERDRIILEQRMGLPT